MRDSSDAVAAVIDAAIDNYVTFWCIMADYYGGAVEREAGLTMVATGLPIPYFNPAIVHRWPDDPVALAKRVQRFGSEHGCPAMIAVWGEHAPRFAPAAMQLGLVDDGLTPKMILFPHEQRLQRVVDGLAIEMVTSEEAQRQFADIVAEGYGMPREFTNGLQHPRLRTRSDITGYIGIVDGRTVAVSALLTTGTIAGVHIVATLPDYRGRGIGAAMTQHCIAAGFANGCTISSLESSALGFPVYQRMGYRHVTDIQGWTFA